MALLQELQNPTLALPPPPPPPPHISARQQSPVMLRGCGWSTCNYWVSGAANKRVDISSKEAKAAADICGGKRAVVSLMAGYCFHVSPILGGDRGRGDHGEALDLGEPVTVLGRGEGCKGALGEPWWVVGRRALQTVASVGSISPRVQSPRVISIGSIIPRLASARVCHTV